MNNPREKPQQGNSWGVFVHKAQAVVGGDTDLFACTAP